jgi:hypothetical protein
MSDTAHASLGPSSAERWMNCPGSVVLSEGMPNKSSLHADEGTRAHEVAETLLRGETPEGTVSVEMMENVMVYVDHVIELADDSNMLHVEVRVKATDAIWGTADAIVWNKATSTLYVRDLKYGAGVGVEVVGNLQLKIYALAALLTMGYPARSVDVGIVQPRKPHADGPIRSIVFDAIDLMDFHADLLDAEARVAAARKDPVAHLKPTEKGCHWCKAAPKCPAIRSRAQSVAKIAFAPQQPYDPKALADVLDFIPILEGWIKNTREFAYAEAEKGHTPPNYKLVDKVATRKWKAAPELVAQTLGVPVSEVVRPVELLPVGDIEKLAPGKNKAERAAVLEPLVTKESSGHTLVHVSDKRDAIRVDAKAAFS